MTDSEFQSLTLVGRHVPDYSTETDSSGNKFQQELPGMFEVGFQSQGVFRPIYTLKAAGLLADVERAKQEQPDAQPAPTEATPSP